MQVTDRRRLLQLAAATAAAGWLPRSAWSQVRTRDNPFTLGVASGSPLADSVVLWTRLVAPELSAQPVTVRWELAHDEAFARVLHSGQAEALPELAHSVHVETAALAPDTGYFYRFVFGEWTSAVGRTRTLPRPDAAMARVRIAYASCQRWEHGFFAAWRHMREDAPDFVLFLGDYMYEYAGAARSVRATDGPETFTLQQYRNRYALYKSDADLQAMHAACPWLFTWDDHEVSNDYAALNAGGGGPSPDFPARRAAAYQAYYEHMPLRASVLTRALQGLAGGAELRLYGEVRFGTLAQLLLLDGRQFRDPQPCSPPGRGSVTRDPGTCESWNDPSRTMLGGAQEQWLDMRLGAGGAAWTVLGQGTLFGQRDFRPGPGKMLWNDGWDGYAAARGRLVQALQQQRAANPVLFGGDIHENWVGQVKADYDRPESDSVGVEFCGTSITSRAFEPDKLRQRMADNPHFVHADAERRGYGIADFTRGRLQVRLRTLDDVTRRDTAVRTEAAFAVEAGRPVVERA
ncbi:alkaline phosphatase D family protein [Ramlibacter sp. PS3R-8]|uniref:alkaline phosphatase D family protein n=1 Tax=Ramlibacter sp. PS3R-8 TaxID=3133437 RepID=UPI00309C6388